MRESVRRLEESAHKIAEAMYAGVDPSQSQ